VVRWLRLPAPPIHQTVHSADELTMLVEESQEAGAITPDEASYARNVFELSEKTIGEVMAPREKVVTLSLAASEEEILATARDTAHTRMPVWEDTPENIVGIVNTKDLFHLFSLRGLVNLMDAMYPPLFIGPEVSLASALRIFRRERKPMAVVRDAGQRYLGIVTLEDVIEEIVGEIEDEHDVHMPHGAVRKPRPAGAPPPATSSTPPATLSTPPATSSTPPAAPPVTSPPTG
jgi:CBS domain containing-hemolysin-like protein